MAENGKTYYDVPYQGGLIRLYNVPDSALQDRETLKKIVENTAAAGKQEVEFSEGVRLLRQSAARPPATPTALAGSPEQKAQLTPAEPAPPETTAGGVAGAAARGAAPTATAAAFGGPLGAAAMEITHMITPFIADFLNEKLNLEGTPWEQMSSREMFDFIHDKLEVEQPDSEIESLVKSVSENVTSAATSIGVGGQMKQAAGLGSNVISGIGQQLSASPIQQITGAATGTVGARYGGRVAGAIAEELGATPRQQELAKLAGQFAGGMLGDLAGSLAVSPIERRIIARGTPMSTKSAQALDTAEPYTGPTRDMPDRPELTTDELMQYSHTTQKSTTGARRRATTPGGAGEFHYQRYLGNKQILAEEMKDFGIEVSDMGRTPDFAESLMDDFLNTRQSRLNEFVGNKREVIERLSEAGDVVNTTATTDLIDNIRADLMDQDPDEFRGFIQKLTNWENVLKDKNLSRIERERRIIGDYITDPNLPGGVKKEAKDAIDSIYASLREDMGNFIETQGSTADYNKWAVANTNLKNMAEEFESSALFRLLEEGHKNPDNIDYDAIVNILTGSNIANARMTYSRLSPEGQGIAKMAIMSDVLRRSNPADLSPNEFARQVQLHLKNLDIALDEGEMDSLMGMKKFFEITAPSERFVRSETGTQRLDTGQVVGSGPLIAHGMRKVGPVGLLAGKLTEATVGKMAINYQRPAVRNLMASLAEVRPGSTAEAELVKRIMRTIGAMEEERSPGELGRARRR